MADTLGNNKSPWAVVIVIIVVITFGIFWYVNERIISSEQPIPVPVTNPPVSTSTSSFEDLQASVADINIPDFSKAF